MIDGTRDLALPRESSTIAQGDTRITTAEEPPKAPVVLSRAKAVSRVQRGTVRVSRTIAGEYLNPRGFGHFTSSWNPYSLPEGQYVANFPI